VPQIRRLVSSSIEGLQYNAVSVVLAEAAPTRPIAPLSSSTNPTVEVLPGLAVRDTDQARFWELATGALVLIVILSATSALGLIAYLRRRRSKPAVGQETSVAVLEPT
jgi:type III secretion protein J